MVDAVTAPTAADVWLLAREHPAPLLRTTRELAESLGKEYGDRFACWRTDEFVFGVRGGKLFLRTLGGLDVPAPKVVCVRQTPGSMRHDREVTLLRHLERMGAVLLNPLDAHLACRNKVWQLQELALAGLPVPDTLSYATAPLEGVVRMPGFDAPYVVKSVNGYRGKQVFLAPDTLQLRDLTGSLAQAVPLLFQEHVTASHGRDLRVVVVDGKPVGAEVRTSRNGTLVSNLARGGYPTLCLGRYPRAEALAVAAARAVGLVVAGVDLLFASEDPDDEDAFVICEVNSVPGCRPEMTEVVPAILGCVDRALRARPGHSSLRAGAGHEGS
ncbi:RimK family alpha-L-glutamate ligase [Streptomyces sp. UNOC14_S4]|uniref:RimK family alpha-L-glutamate ligase n=1 Tax=Streptomyces sp. UNOC14_S4 TaxID=2872340 RepID=UPI001E56B3B2|nr:RimK family alpha-L-glutamate ligase [Streptomyces sp. UNOC14_S4]MCC3769202.1 RimK family alpha-L-glutamate ligase [Streptomyces sp. UNOC14_S4]